ncbi:MAG: hypothetical protein HY842_17470 [Bacteroidetes bacterium]|nr:hypothetical protein [Bacteroidota bacterium]
MPTRSIHTFPIAVLMGYALVSLLLLWHHEPWRDEMQCWEIARRSASLSELFFNARYEGHPSAWYLLLFAITRFTPDFAAVQVLHWLLALASVALVLWRSPFSRWQKGLMVFGYFFLFEYGVLTRNYAIGVLLALALCSLAQDWKRHWLAMQVLLFCLLQCSLFAALVACAFFVPLFFVGIRGLRQNALAWQKIALGALIFLGGLLLSAFDMMPPADTNYAAAWKWSTPDWQPALGAFFRAMLPVPPLGKHGWGSHVLFQLLEWDQRVLVECTMSLVLLVCCLFSLRKSPFALAFFGLAWAAIGVFLAVKFPGFIRHHGHFYLAWVMALWVKPYFSGPSSHSESRGTNAFFTFILVLQVAAAVPLAYFDLKFPFSQSRAVADFLKQNHLEDRLLVGDYDYAASPVAFHLRRPIYYPNALKKGSFILWNKEQEALKITDIVPVALDLCQQHGDPDASGQALLLLTSYAIPAEHLVPSVHLIKTFAPAMEISEEYHLYEVRCGGG